MRDLVDLMLLRESDLLSMAQLAPAVAVVCAERESTTPPEFFPNLPASWLERYERLAAENDIEPSSFSVASRRGAELWADMFPTKET